MIDYATPPGTFDYATFCDQPQVRGSAAAKIMILRGPVYSDDTAWEGLMRYKAEVERFLAEVGARLIVDEHDGYAFADQATEGEPGADWPKLFYRDRFSYDVTCVLLVLREWLLQREAVATDKHAPLLAEALLADLRRFSRKANANVEREDKRWREAVNKAVGYGFLKRAKGEEECYIVRPIVRAKFTLEVLKDLRAALERAATAAHEVTDE